MTDIVERLRRVAASGVTMPDDVRACVEEAADEIARLRARVAELEAVTEEDVERAMSERILRILWAEAGGEQYGPIVETLCIRADDQWSSFCRAVRDAARAALGAIRREP